ADRLGTNHTSIVLTEDELLSWIPDSIASIDQPTIDGINTWIISRATRQAGVTVALSGLGGDELFGGYPRFRRARRVDRYIGTVGWLRRNGGPIASPTVLNAAARSRLARVTRAVMGDSVSAQKTAAVIASGDDWLAAYAAMRGLFSIGSR